ncbi:MAG TPA: FecR domain-containing protein [Candidatus Limnocylindria bacterium]
MALCVGTVPGIGSTPVAANVQAPAHTPLRAAAVLTVISGDVQTRFGGSGFSSATDGAVLYVGSTVRTSGDARAVLTLFEGSTIELEPASDITIEEATTRSSSTIVQLAQSVGRSWHVVTHLTTADSRYEVRTPAATASVRGTAFEVAVDDALSGPTTTVTTTEGRVATADTAGSSEVLVTADQITTVRANTAPEPPRAAPDAQRVVSVAVVSESSLVVDPLGRVNGFKDGKVFAQTPGARVRMQDGTIVVTLPNVPDGVFATTVSAGTSATVSTTVTDKGEEPVRVNNAVEAGSASTTSGVELRKGSDMPQVRSLTPDETQKLSDAKFGAKAKVRAIAKQTLRAPATTEGNSGTTRAPTKKNDATPQPAATPRRTEGPTPARR